MEISGNHVETLFLNNHTLQYCFDKIKEALTNFSPDIIGYQILTVNRASSYRLIEYIHEQHPKIQQVIGGIHATIMYKQLLEKYPYLIAVIGEGEITFPELIRKLTNEPLELEQIDGIAYNRNGVVHATNPRRLIENLDELPIPKHELFFNPKRIYGNIMTSRGCPFNCSFCCLDKLSQRRVRKRSVANIIKEIEWLIKKYPNMKAIWIHDDTFFIDNKHTIELCDEIIKRKLNISFVCSGRVKPISQELVTKLEKANFKKILLGLESGDEGILKRCHKNITQVDVEHAFRLFSKTNIFILAFLIVGLPGETIETIKETAKFVKKLQKIKYVPYNDAAVLSVYPGTEVYEIAKAGGMIDDDFWLTDKPTPLFTLENSQDKLFEFKEILLNNVSTEKIFTLAGFKAQFTMLPYILKYIYKNPFSLKSMAVRIFKKILPKKIYDLLKNCINKNYEKYKYFRNTLRT